MKADIKADNQPDEIYSAAVGIVDRVIDPASNTFGVRLELPNPDYRLPVGLKCTVRFLDNAETVSPAEPTDNMEIDKVAKGSQRESILTTVNQ